MLLSLGINDSSFNLLETTQDAVLVLDISGTMKYANSSFYSLLGYLETDIVGKNYSEINCDPPVSFEELIRALTLKLSFMQQFNCLKKDGSVTPLTASFTFINDNIEIYKGVLVVIKNKLLETAIEKEFLLQQNHLLRSLNHRPDEMCLVYDMINYRNLYCSDTIETVLGWTSDEYLNGGWAFSLSITHPDDASTIETKFKIEVSKRMQSPSALDTIPIVFEYRKRHRNGAYKWIRAESWVLNRNAHGELSHMLVFLKDISTEKIREQLEHNPNLLELIQNGVEHIKIKSPDSGLATSYLTNFQLSVREKEILDLIKKGLSSKEISSKLSLTVNTVNTYRKNLMNKFHAKNSAELVQIAMQKNIG